MDPVYIVARYMIVTCYLPIFFRLGLIIRPHSRFGLR